MKRSEWPKFNQYLVVIIVGLLMIIAYLLGRSPNFFQSADLIKPTPTQQILPSVSPTQIPTVTSSPTLIPPPTLKIVYKPSNRALRAAAFVFTHSTDEYKTTLKNKYGDDTVNNLAKFLDNNADKLALVEQAMNEYQTRRLQNNQSNMHCSSDMIGGFNCYSY